MMDVVVVSHRKLIPYSYQYTGFEWNFFTIPKSGAPLEVNWLTSLNAQESGPRSGHLEISLCIPRAVHTHPYLADTNNSDLQASCQTGVH